MKTSRITSPEQEEEIQKVSFKDYGQKKSDDNFSDLVHVHSEEGGRVFHRNVDNYLPVYTS
jgi:hypothetical protein